MALSIEEAAARLGMHPGEVVDVTEKRGEGTVVTLQDGHRQLLNAEGVWWYTADKAPNAGLPKWIPGSGEADEPAKTPAKK